MVIASWDGTIRGWRLPRARFQEGDWLQFRGSPLRTGLLSAAVSRGDGSINPSPLPVGNPEITGTRTEEWFGGVKRVILQGTDLGRSRRLVVRYKIPGEKSPHLSPVVRSGDHFVALVQPLRTPQRLQYWVELERYDGTTQRWPPNGVERVFQLPAGIDWLFRTLRGSSIKKSDRPVGRQNA